MIYLKAMSGVKILQEKDKNVLAKVVSSLKRGKVLIVPTDTVYGFIADATNVNALRKIFRIKKRNKKKPLGVFVKNIAMAKRFAKISASQEQFLKKVWPGKVIVLLQSKNKLPKELGASKTIGIRIPNYDLIQCVIKKLKRPLAQTSVNISGKSPLKTAQEMVKVFSLGKYRPDMIIDAGILLASKASKVVDITQRKPILVRK